VLQCFSAAISNSYKKIIYIALGTGTGTSVPCRAISAVILLVLIASSSPPHSYHTMQSSL
jgi:hypothetical protein